ncbi:hypothetical protein VNI00_017485 [Paramarasmius palmivorus]|uniref:Glycoside hydrolase family 76 protein n=1 Tax=Paramarasmius palmivorus TaxID=297713 RepID=A0AAW0B687_9AGAR
MLLFVAVVWYLHVVSKYITATAQGLISNPLWSNPNITLKQDVRIAIAKEAIERARVMLDEKQLQNGTYYGATARLYSQMAEFDTLTNQTTYQGQLYQAFEKARYVREDFLDYTSYGVAALRAYAAYGNESFIKFAEVAWNSAMSCTMSSEAYQSGQLCNQNVTDLKESCEGAEIITNTTHYLDLATRAADFVLHHLADPQGAIQDSINERTCEVTEESRPHNAGLVLEGLAILSTANHYPRFEDSLLRVLNNTVTSKIWQSDNGIISSDGGQYILRGLSVIYQRALLSQDVRNYIKNYIGVQYNAVLANSRVAQNPNIYSGSWTGPPSTGYSIQNQTNAISVLLAAIPLPEDTAPAASEPTEPDAPNDRKRSLKIGIILGAVFGGIVCLTLLAGIAFILVNCKQLFRSTMHLDQARSKSKATKGRNDRTPRPFIMDYDTKPRPRKYMNYHSVSAAPIPSIRISPGTGNSNTTPMAGPSNQFDNGTTSGNDSDAPKLGYIPTSELVRVLNDRLQPEHWRDDEVPPEYASQRG